MNGYGHFVPALVLGDRRTGSAIFAVLGVLSIALHAPRRRRRRCARASRLARGARLPRLVPALALLSRSSRSARALGTTTTRTCCNEYLDCQGPPRASRPTTSANSRSTSSARSRRSRPSMRPSTSIPSAARSPAPARYHAAEQDRRSRCRRSTSPTQQQSVVERAASTGRSIWSAARRAISTPSTRSSSRSQPGDVLTHDVRVSAHDARASATATSAANSPTTARSSTPATSRTIGYDAQYRDRRSAPPPRRETRRARRDGAARRPAALALNLFTPNRDWITYPHGGQHVATIRSPSRPATCSATWTAERPPLLRVQHGRDAHRSISSPISRARYAVRKEVYNGPNGPVNLEVYYDPRTRYDIDDMLASSRAGLDYFQAQLQPVPVHAVPHHGVPALPHVRAVVSQHRSVLRRDRLHRAHGEANGHRSHVLRHRARARAPVVGPPAHRRRRCRAPT